MAASDNEKTRAAGAYLKEHYIDKGKLGRASGEGFYEYAAARSTAKPEGIEFLDRLMCGRAVSG